MLPFLGIVSSLLRRNNLADHGAATTVVHLMWRLISQQNIMAMSPNLGAGKDYHPLLKIVSEVSIVAFTTKCLPSSESAHPRLTNTRCVP